MLAVVCPGQGAQTPGFLSPWLELADARTRLERFSGVIDVDLVAHGTTSDADTIRDTAVAQPLIVAAGLLALAELFPGVPSGAAPATASPAGGAEISLPAAAGAVVTAGHSVGEFTAAVAAGVLTPDAALGLVQERGRRMAAASALVPTGMSAVVGGVPEEVEAAIDRSGAVAANRNGAGQVVAAGTLAQLAALAAAPPARARVIPLQVAGAFHTAHMAPARDALSGAAAELVPADPLVVLLSNADGAPVTDGATALERLVAQTVGPVRWDLCQETLLGLGVSALLEVTPAGTLTGLAKRAMRGVELLALKTPDDLDAARDLVARHTAPMAPIAQMGTS